MPESAILAPEAPAPEILSEPDLDDKETPLLSELLVEEVSIDGMCGVY